MNSHKLHLYINTLQGQAKSQSFDSPCYLDQICASGDILKFAGDAILTLWESDPHQFPATIDKVVTAAINIQCKMDNYMTG